MKNLNLRLFFGMTLVVLMSCYSIGQGIGSVELPSLNLALAQRLDLGLTPGHGGGGGTTCGGSTCDSANGNNYGTITMNNVTKCCGSASTSSGSKSS